jgi:hypothetical protein
LLTPSQTNSPLEPEFPGQPVSIGAFDPQARSVVTLGTIFS